MLINEIIYDKQEWSNFKKTIARLATSTNEKIQNKNGRNLIFKNEELWKKMLKSYKEYLEDIEKYILNFHKSEKYKPIPSIPSLRDLKTSIRSNQMFLLSRMGYDNFGQDVLQNFGAIKNYFVNTEKEIKDGDFKVSNLLHLLNIRAGQIENIQPSVNTEEINYFPY